MDSATQRSHGGEINVNKQLTFFKITLCGSYFWWAAGIDRDLTAKIIQSSREIWPFHMKLNLQNTFFSSKVIQSLSWNNNPGWDLCIHKVNHFSNSIFSGLFYSKKRFFMWNVKHLSIKSSGGSLSRNFLIAKRKWRKVVEEEKWEV